MSDDFAVGYFGERRARMAGLESFVDVVFGGDVPDHPLELYQVAARAALLYVVALVVVRVGKGRLMGGATSLDVVVAVVLGSLVGRGVTGNASLSGTAVGSAVLVAAHWLLTLVAYYSHGFGDLVKGHHHLLVRDGVLLPRAMRGSHISENDLAEAVRLAGIAEMSEVREAHKERNGEISVIRRRPEPTVLDVAVRDGVQTVRIQIG
jgi:uncharacterized membrane protein YcaP (DUF421 family)